jgi:hypothetical protein
MESYVFKKVGSDPDPQQPVTVPVHHKYKVMKNSITDLAESIFFTVFLSQNPGWLAALLK